MYIVYNPTTTKARGSRTEMYMLKLSVQKSFVPVSCGGGMYTNKLIIDSTIHFKAPAKASFNLSPSHEKPLSNQPLLDLKLVVRILLLGQLLLEGLSEALAVKVFQSWSIIS